MLKPVGSGEELTAVTYTTQGPPTPAEQNPAWQRVNQELGVNVKLPLTQLADYPTDSTRPVRRLGSGATLLTGLKITDTAQAKKKGHDRPVHPMAKRRRRTERAVQRELA